MRELVASKEKAAFTWLAGCRSKSPRLVKFAGSACTKRRYCVFGENGKGEALTKMQRYIIFRTALYALFREQGFSHLEMGWKHANNARQA